jgi:hypothetical protein
VAKITPKQQRFVEEYMIDLNAKQAAIRAGYSWGDNAGYYVYFLIDPRNNKIFYVGKGKGGRLFAHAKQAANGKIPNAPKHKMIVAIQAAGLDVVEVVFAGGLNESSALSLERTLIDALKDFGICNIANGVMSNAEKVSLEAKVLMDHIKPYDEWAQDPHAVAVVTSAFGDPLKFYNTMMSSLDDIYRAGLPAQ